MGCDGGTIPRRDELVRTKKKPEQVYLFLTAQIIFQNTFYLLHVCYFRKIKMLNVFLNGNIVH